jgi:esterase/lipase
MELNDFLFPSPKFNPQNISPYINEILLIPKPNSSFPYIPTLYLPFIPTTAKSSYISHCSSSLLILFHSNGEDLISSRIFANKLRIQLQINILIVEYPGYSLYNTSKNCETVLEDTLIVYDYILTNIPNVNVSNIYIIGRSIGTAPAIYLSSKRKVGMLFLISPFTSIKAVAGNMFGFLKLFVSERFVNGNYIQDVKCPVLFIHGYKDKMIPYNETLLLKDKLNGIYEVCIQSNMTHNEFNVESDIIQPIKEFIERNAGKREEDVSEGMWITMMESLCGKGFDIEKLIKGS